MPLISQLADRFKAELVGQIISVISGAILTVALAHLLNPDGYGLLFLAISVLGTIKTFSKLGVAKSASRYIAEYKETDSGQIRHILKFSFVLNLLTIAVVCFGTLLSYKYIANLIGESDLVPFLLLGVLFLIFGTLVTFVRTVLQGFEAIKAGAVLHAVDRGTRLVLALGFVVLGYGAIGALLGYIIAFAITAVLGLMYLYIRHYRSGKRSERESDLRRRIVEYTIPLTATGTADVLDKRVDTVIVGFFLGPIAVAYYTLGRQIVTFIQTPMSALGFTLSPTYESQKAKGNTETAAQLYEQALIHGLAVYIPAAAGLILVAEPLVTLAFGDDYLGAVPILQVLAVYAVLQSITALTSNGLDFLGRARERAIIKGVTSVLNVILNIILIPRIGVVGAAIATLATYSIYTFTNVYIIGLEFDLQTRLILRNVMVILSITSVMSACVYVVSDYVTGFITLFAVIGFGTLVWLSLIAFSGVLDFRKIISTLS
ncbi:flippase [Natrinema salsiterrestre]|uniref:Flippase n=1 Tax=Natrinema salsiterrestre TaxID=2950540 RepID=A0A9Q4L3R4_9EURY|nr:flippase [Natrinema salsiterrestre]MDF9745977.1 flippase [Natrinema salsiterrestre]